MCEKCEAKREVLKALGLINVHEVGTVSEELRLAFNKVHQEHTLGRLDMEQETINTRRRIVLEELTQEDANNLQADFNIRFDAFEKKYDDLNAEMWEKVYAEFGIVGTDKDKDHSINRSTGVVTLEEKTNSGLHGLFEGMKGVHIFGGTVEKG